MIEAIIVEDDIASSKVLQKLCEQTTSVSVKKVFASAEGVQEYLDSNPELSVIFLDINLPDNLGLDLARSLLIHQPDIQIVFTTGYKNYAVDAFDINATDYLIKPINQVRFQQAIDRVFARQKASLPEFIMVKSLEGTKRINIDAILYIKSAAGWAQIYLKGEEKIDCYTSLKDLIEELPEERFIRPHNSYIVNLEFIDSKTSNSVYIGDVEIGIGRTRKKEFVEQFAEYQQKKGH